MPLPLRHLTLRRALLALSTLALLAVVAAVALGHHDTSPARAKEPLARLASPGTGWVAGGPGLDLGWEEDTVEHDSHGVWTGVDPESSSIRYAVTWHREVGRGDGAADCSQVAGWLLRTGPRLPGRPDGHVEDIVNPGRPELLERCRRVLADNAPGRTVDETFAMWQPSTRHDGFEYTAYVTFHGDAGHRTLVVTALAQQIQS